MTTRQRCTENELWALHTSRLVADNLERHDWVRDQQRSLNQIEDIAASTQIHTTTHNTCCLFAEKEHKKQIAEWSQKCIPVKILAQTQIHINTTFLTNRAHIHTRHTSETTKARLAYNSSISNRGVSIKKDIHPSGRFHHRQQRQ